MPPNSLNMDKTGAPKWFNMRDIANGDTLFTNVYLAVRCNYTFPISRSYCNLEV